MAMTNASECSKRDKSLRGVRLIALYLALLATAAFVLTLLDPSGPF